ncbi:MAG: glyoxalase [Candidatus Puniceispirillales bacterium]
MTDFETIEADELGRSLHGFGINLLCPDPLAYAPGLARVLGLTVIRLDAFFGLLSWKQEPDTGSLIQLHADSTYAANPYHAMLAENTPRGIGLELRLFACDPDAAVARAEAEEGYTILQPATDKEHGIREAYILDPLGYCWVPSQPL